MNHIGIDIGSKTLKVIMGDAENPDADPVFTLYTRHKSRVQESLTEAIHSLLWRLGDQPVRVTVTGSAGMRIAELFDIPFVQEVVALRHAVQHFYPEADAVLEMGGEDTKLLYLSDPVEQRMNTVCAGGTGGFIEALAHIMGVRTRSMNKLALGYKTIYPIASRCAVFAKTDVRPLLNAGARKEDIAASVLEAVCTQAIAGLSAGRPLEGTILLLGGPFEYIGALRDAFCRVSGISRMDAVVPKNAHLMVVRGALLSPEKSREMLISDLEKALSHASFQDDQGINRLPALFKDQAEIDSFRQRHSQHCLPRIPLGDAGRNLFLGVDAGSTTMKLALINEEGALAAYEYDWNGGDAVDSLSGMLASLYRQLEAPWSPEHIIRRSCIVGYGENFCKAAFGIDKGEVETVAHLRAAQELVPDVDFLMDIGGQDIKCFYVEDGVIQDVVLNEACSSGCGSLFDSVARSMASSKERFASLALLAQHPVDLGTRCATFMDSRIKHAQKEGVSHADIAAGVCYATVRNALYKVVRQPDFSQVGNHIVVQGGAFSNDALLRAFEQETGTQVIRPDKSQLMGAWGAALLARDEWLAQREEDAVAAENVVSDLISRADLSHFSAQKSAKRCDQCPNKCQLLVTHFSVKPDDTLARLGGRMARMQPTRTHSAQVQPTRDHSSQLQEERSQSDGGQDTLAPDRVYVTGNRCEKGALAFGSVSESKVLPPNMFKIKRALLAAFDKRPQPAHALCAIGIPRALALYESYPFWRVFFNELGLAVVGSPESSESVYRSGMSCIPSEGMCYPAKLLFGHAVEVLKQGADVLFMPNMGMRFARVGLSSNKGETPAFDTLECPIVQNAGDLLLSNAYDSALRDVQILVPDFIHMHHAQEIVTPMRDVLGQVGLTFDTETLEHAVDVARTEYAAFFADLSTHADRILASIDAGEYPGALVSGHAYHVDPGINHRIDDLLGNLGYAVLEDISYDHDNVQQPFSFSGYEWAENRAALSRIEKARNHPLVQLVVQRSFGCGIDALVSDEIHDALVSEGRISAELKLDQIVDLATIRIRLRSLAYAHKQRACILNSNSVHAS